MPNSRCSVNLIVFIRTSSPSLVWHGIISHLLPSPVCHVPLHHLCPSWFATLYLTASLEFPESKTQRFFVNGVQGTNVAAEECFFLESPNIRFIAKNKAYAWSMGSNSELKSTTSPLQDVVVTTQIVGMRTSRSWTFFCFAWRHVLSSSDDQSKLCWFQIHHLRKTQ